MCGQEFCYSSLSPGEYRRLLAENGLEVLLHKAEDPACGNHTVWLAVSIVSPDLRKAGN